jgi:hypothetical protein
VNRQLGTPPSMQVSHDLLKMPTQLDGTPLLGLGQRSKNDVTSISPYVFFLDSCKCQVPLGAESRFHESVAAPVGNWWERFLS